MLVVQLCRRSRSGVVIPVACDYSPQLVGMVALAILRGMKGRNFRDEVLAAFNRQERAALEATLAEEGVSSMQGGR